MVGHTGVWDATVEACAFLDGCLGRVADAVLGRGRGVACRGWRGALLAITADHGNADVMRDASGRRRDRPLAQPGAVPARRSVRRRASRCDDGVLADVAPTLLELLGLPPAAGMTGSSLLRRSAGTA